MFSRERVSAFINRHFETAWEMVRTVPIIRIDFGNGRTTTRTLHGNVASYVCKADGQVMDILPGIYTPGAYTAALEQPRALAGAVSRLVPDRQLPHLREYHRDNAQRLRQAGQPRFGGNGQGNPEQDRGKGFVERVVLPALPNFNAAAAGPRPRTAAELAGWQPLVEDTLINERLRRLQIHERLMGADALRPDQIKRWLYRDVLHADLDYPFMGLGDDMFADIER